MGDVAGEGPPVVLLHAGVADRRMWNGVLPALTASYQVVRYDLRGYGESPPSTQPYQPADDLAAVLDHLSLAGAHLVGASMGGYVSLDFAVAQPGRVRSLALLAPGLPGHDFGPGVRAYFDAEEAALERGDIDAVVELNLETWVRGARAAWSPRLRAVGEELRDQLRIIAVNQSGGEDFEEAAPTPARAHLAELAVPTLVLIADADHADFVAIAEHIAATIPGARSVRLPDTAHLPALERPDDTAAALLVLPRHHLTPPIPRDQGLIVALEDPKATISP